jgi:CRP-like cAMP-binding protein
MANRHISPGHLNSKHAVRRSLKVDLAQSFIVKNGNRLTSVLADNDWERWKTQIELVHLKVGEVLFDAGQPIRHIYFPLTGIISQQYDFEDGKSAEFAQMGNEGMAGVFIFMGSASTSSKAIVIASGIAYRLPAAWMLSEFNSSGMFRQLILHYMQILMTHASQLAVCNRRHSIDQQLCRTLLLQLDRVAGDDLSLTHELISRSMGVRREGVSEAAKRLEKIGAIRYSRGHIQVLDRASLLKNSCECYSIIKREDRRLFPPLVT